MTIKTHERLVATPLDSINYRGHGTRYRITREGTGEVIVENAGALMFEAVPVLVQRGWPLDTRVAIRLSFQYSDACGHTPLGDLAALCPGPMPIP